MTRVPLALFAKTPASRTLATVGLLATAGVLATPAAAQAAAPGAGDPATTTTTTDTTTNTSTPDAEVLPATTPTVTATGAHFGTGKLTVSVSATDGVPAGTTVSAAGAHVAVHIEEQGAAAVDELCTVDSSGCGIDGTAAPIAGPGTPVFPEYVQLPQNATVSFTLIGAPTDGKVLAAGAAPVVGYTDGTSTGTTTIQFSAHGAYRTLGVALSGTGSLNGAGFTLCTVPVGLGDCSSGENLKTATTGANGTATFDGLYRPGNYTVTQTSGPGGTTFDPAPKTLPVPAATTLAQRDAVVPLAVGGATGPVLTPAPTPSTPAPAPATTPAPAAPAPTTAPAAASTPAPVQGAAKASVVAGKAQTVTLGGFQPFEKVHGVLHSTPVDLGTATADANGVATFTFTVPAGVELGSHEVVLTGLTSGKTAQASFTVTTSNGSTKALAYTGADVVPVAALGGGLVLAGGAALLLVRRRRSA